MSIPPTSTDITWHDGEVTRAMRATLNGHAAATLWFTGLSGSGKSTLSRAVEAALHHRGVRTYVLDGDNVRHGLNADLGFSPEDRQENIRRIGEVTKLLTDAGVVNFSVFISPYREDRDRARELQPGDFIEVHVDCTLEVCEARDPKGIYQKARRGLIKDFTGVSVSYEAPERPEVYLNTSTMSIEACVETLISALIDRGIIGQVVASRFVRRSAELTSDRPQ